MVIGTQFTILDATTCSIGGRSTMRPSKRPGKSAIDWSTERRVLSLVEVTSLLLTATPALVLR